MPLPGLQVSLGDKAAVKDHISGAQWRTGKPHHPKVIIWMMMSIVSAERRLVPWKTWGQIKRLSNVPVHEAELQCEHTAGTHHTHSKAGGTWALHASTAPGFVPDKGQIFRVLSIFSDLTVGGDCSRENEGGKKSLYGLTLLFSAQPHYQDCKSKLLTRKIKKTY